MLRKSDCLGCAVLLCHVVCLTLLAFFFHFSLKHVHVYIYILGLVFGVIGGFIILHVHTELIVSLFIRCTTIYEIWAQPAELPWELRSLCLEVRVSPEAAYFSQEK